MTLMMIITIYGVTIQSCSGAWVLLIILLVIMQLYRLVPVLFTPVQLCTYLNFWEIFLLCQFYECR